MSCNELMIYVKLSLCINGGIASCESAADKT